MISIPTHSSNETLDSLTVSIRVEPDGTLYAQNVELVNNDTRLRFVFGKGKSLCDIFSPEMRQELGPLIERALARRGVVVLPDYRVFLKNLVLAKCRVLMTPSGQGGEHVLVCFREYFGNIYSILHESITKVAHSNGEACDVAVELLESAYIPIMNLGEHLKTILDRRDDMEPEEMRTEMMQVYDRILQLKFYQSMLMRYINSETMDMQSRALPAPESAQQNPEEQPPLSLRA